MAQDIGGLHHLHHEGREPARKEIGRAHASEDAVYHANSRRLGGEETTDLRQQHQQSGLTGIGAFPSSVRTSQEQEPLVLIKMEIIRDKAASKRFHHGMAPLSD